MYFEFWEAGRFNKSYQVMLKEGNYFLGVLLGGGYKQFKNKKKHHLFVMLTVIKYIG